MPDDGVPDIFTDNFRFTLSPYGMAFTFGRTVAHPEQSKPQPSDELVRLRMSLEQAKVLAMMLRRDLKKYERENNLEIALPAQMYTSLGIAKEDWGFE